MSAENLFEHLLSDNIIGSQGKIYCEFAGIKLKVNDVSVVGNVIQEWLSNYMTSKKIYFRTKPNTQDFPDFLLDENDSDVLNLLEVKAFTKSPNFDVANFSAYARSVREHPYRLDAKYLIFEYEPTSENENQFTVKNIWLKNVWQICSGSERSAIKIQWKQGDPVNIRPATFYSEKAKYRVFSSRADFVLALSQVINTSRLDPNVQRNWLKVVQSKYLEECGIEL